MFLEKTLEDHFFNYKYKLKIQFKNVIILKEICKMHNLKFYEKVQIKTLYIEIIKLSYLMIRIVFILTFRYIV